MLRSVMMLFIREIELSEMECCAELIRNSFGTVAAEFGLTPQNCPSNGAFIDATRLKADREKGARMFGLFCHGELAGFAQLMKKGEDAFSLEKLAVHPAYRNRGYGAYLLSRVRSEAVNAGAAKLLVGIIEENIRLKGWYVEHGFRPTGTRRFEHLPFTVGFLEMNL